MYKNTSFECSVCDWIHCFVGQVQCHKVRLSVAFERGSFFKNTCTSLDSVKTMHRFAWICDPETGYSGCVPLKAGYSLMSKSSMDSWGCGIKNLTALTALTKLRLRCSQGAQWGGQNCEECPGRASNPRILEAPLYDDSFGLISLITFSISVKSQDI